jgi:hypothetical protein
VTTNEDRAWALEQAKKRQHFHEQRGDYDYQIADDLEGWQAHYRGLLGECEFKRQFGTIIDVTLRPGGDDGWDFEMETANGSRVKIDVKTSSYFGTERYLRVPADHIHADVLYVAALYEVADDDVVLSGWEWGRVLIDLGTLMAFSTRGTQNYVRPINECHKLDELREFIYSQGKKQRQDNRPPVPDLQELVRRFGGYNKITAEGWAQHDADTARYMAWVRRRGA